MAASSLDANQVLRSAHDESKSALKIVGLDSAVGVAWDYGTMALSAGNTVETYTFKVGGSGGTVVRTIVMTYTDSTRATLSSFSKS